MVLPMQRKPLTEEDRLRIAEEKRLQALKSKVVRLREKWLKLVKEESFDTCVVQPKSNRSPTKTLYFVSDWAITWLDTMEKEFEKLEKLVRKSFPAPKTRSRMLWVPPIMHNPIEIKIMAKPGRSVRSINLSQARAFVGKSGKPVDRPLPDGKFFISSRTGYKYSLRAKYADMNSESFPCPEWTVCHCTDASKPPPIRRHTAKRTKKVAEALDAVSDGTHVGIHVKLRTHDGNVLFARLIDEDGWD